MKFLVIIIWVLLGVTFFLTWSGQRSLCCEDNSTEQETSLIAEAGQAGMTTGSDSHDPGNDSKVQDSIFEKSEVNENAVTEERVGDNSSLEGEKGRVDESRETPKKALKEAQLKQFKNRDIYFGLNQVSRFDIQKYGTFLDSLVSFVKDESELKIKLAGNTDASGNPGLNMKVGLRRAQSVANYLMEKGVDISRIEMTSNGEKIPLGSNDSAEGRALNRRVEITLNK